MTALLYVWKPRSQVVDKRRDQIIRFFAEFVQVHHNAPSTLEIGRHFGIAQQTAHSHMVKLMAEGRVIQVDGRWRLPGAEYIPPDDL